MKTLKEAIDEVAGNNTYRRTGYIIEACMSDAKMRQGLWQPQDTLPVIAEFWAGRHPWLAQKIITIYFALWGKKEVTK